MEKKKAHYVLYSAEQVGSILGGSFKYISLYPEDEEALKNELASWEIVNYMSYCYEYDDYDDKSYGSSTSNVPVSEMISINSGMYSTNDVRGEILVEDGRFVGVVLIITEEGGSNWSSYRNSHYCILYADGRVEGKAESSYSFYGESSSKESTNSYSLKKIIPEEK